MKNKPSKIKHLWIVRLKAVWRASNNWGNQCQVIVGEKKNQLYILFYTFSFFPLPLYLRSLIMRWECCSCDRGNSAMALHTEMALVWSLIPLDIHFSFFLHNTVIKCDLIVTIHTKNNTCSCHYVLYWTHFVNIENLAKKKYVNPLANDL